MSLVTAPKGTADILPAQSYKWQYLEKNIRELCRLYGFSEIRTPVFEHTEVFVRGVGDTTDVVTKEMYTFEDKGGRSITLRPEGTAGIVRSFLENGIFNDPLPAKLFYLINCFRYENRKRADSVSSHNSVSKCSVRQAPRQMQWSSRCPITFLKTSV